MNPYDWFLKIRNYLYENQHLKVYRAPIPVISVGNLNTGGSGKTPFIQYLVQEIQQLHPHKKIVIISKSYKAQAKQPLEVTETDTKLYGDEPCLLKSTLNVDVWAGPTKAETLEHALVNKKYDLAIVDDGFSHCRLARDLNIVLFDVSQPVGHYRLLPWGNLREPFHALARSDVVVLTKSEGQDIEKIRSYRLQIENFQKNIIDSQFHTIFENQNRDVFLYTGIANPSVLIKNLKVAQAKIYADHYDYPMSEQEKIKNDFLQMKSQGELDLVTTEKDFIKIQNDFLKKETKVVKLAITLNEDSRRWLNDQISRLF